MKLDNKTNGIFAWVITVGMLLIVAGVMMPILGTLFNHTYGTGITVSRWVFCAGAALNMAGRAFTRYTGDNLRVKRLFRLEVWSGIFFCVSGFFQFFSPWTPDWIAFTLAGGAILVYTSIMIPKVSKNG